MSFCTKISQTVVLDQQKQREVQQRTEQGKLLVLLLFVSEFFKHGSQVLNRPSLNELREGIHLRNTGVIGLKSSTL